ncbi:LysE family translocator [Marinomonas polaris]|uniref:LysE family translocator n=1 Tax=Marinomonas polaris TaxID=293552 RepID=UPI003F94A7A7
MTFETWIAYLLASLIISIIPGPSVFTVLAQSISYGAKHAFLCIFGDITAAMIVMLLSYLGVGALLMASEQLFFLVKWTGVIYIAYLGVMQIIAAMKVKADSITIDNYPKKSSCSIKVGFFTGLLNPKGIIFSMAFLSQFIDVNANPVHQLVILMITNALVIVAVLGSYALLAVKIKSVLNKGSNKKVIGLVGGGSLFGSSVFMMFSR